MIAFYLSISHIHQPSPLAVREDQPLRWCEWAICRHVSSVSCLARAQESVLTLQLTHCTCDWLSQREVTTIERVRQPHWILNVRTKVNVWFSTCGGCVRVWRSRAANCGASTEGTARYTIFMPHLSCLKISSVLNTPIVSTMHVSLLKPY